MQTHTHTQRSVKGGCQKKERLHTVHILCQVQSWRKRSRGRVGTARLQLELLSLAFRAFDCYHTTTTATELVKSTTTTTRKV